MRQFALPEKRKKGKKTQKETDSLVCGATGTT